MSKRQGKVKWFNEQKGFGFIQPDDGSKDVFVHISEVNRARLQTLKENERVAYVEGQNKSGTVAQEIEKI